MIETAKGHVWRPRQDQEERLRWLDSRLAAADVTIDEKVERAALLAALQRDADAQQAFVDVLLQTPSHLGALIAFGNFLTARGHISAACRVYSEAVARHPDDPIGHVNLANLLLRGCDLAGARRHYDAALQLDPEHAQAHQGLGAVLSESGEDERARLHFGKGFRGHAVSTRPYRGTEPPVPVLLLVSSGGGNIPTDPFLDDQTFLTSVIVADYLEPATPLPPHALVFNAIGDADRCAPALEAAVQLMARTGAPMINRPSAVLRTGRIANAERLRAIAGVRAPLTASVPRALLAAPDAAAGLAAHGFSFPLLLRSPGFHTGRNFVKIDSAAALSAALATLPGDELLVIEYLDARGADGNARKYRAMLIDGRIYPLHLAVSRQWKVHYFTSDMKERPDHRGEEAAFLADMRKVLGPRAMTGLEQIARTLGLDYGGIDFGLDGNGDLLLFEANATMVIVRPEDDERWAYRQTAVDRILRAVTAMILDRADGQTASRVA